MDAILQARAIPMPRLRCAALAGVSKGCMYHWLRQGMQIAVENGKLDESVLEGGSDVDLPATKKLREQVEHFAVQWHEIEKGAEAGLVRQVRRCADGYVVEEQETERVWQPTKGKRKGRWLNSKQKTKRKNVPADWRAAVHLLQMDHEEYREMVGVSATLREEVGGMSDDEIMAELKGSERELDGDG